MALPGEPETDIRQRMSPNSIDQKRDDTPIAEPERSIFAEALELFYSIPALSIVKFFCISVTIGSFMYEFFPPGESFFSNKYNFLNQYFVKLAWGWTMALHTPLTIITGLLHSPANFLQIFKGLARILLVGTTVWYCWVEIVFHWVMQVTGSCVGDETLMDVRSCFKAGHRWDGFDISGHCFLLIYSALLIHEEIQTIQRHFVIQKLHFDSEKQNDSEEKNVKFSKLMFLQNLFTTLMILLEGLWMLMVTMTAVYFHAWSHKLIGASIAIVSWHVTYNIWYLSKFSPGSCV